MPPPKFSYLICGLYHSRNPPLCAFEFHCLPIQASRQTISQGSEAIILVFRFVSRVQILTLQAASAHLPFQ